MAEIEVYDTTLRDGTQREGISLSLEDKVRIARRLDETGVHYIEGGWPGSNPKDMEFFDRAAGMTWRHARIAAFGSTRRKGTTPEGDANIQELVRSRAPVIALVGKSSPRQVQRVLETTLEDNLAMIAESVGYLKNEGRLVFFDAEHFFDGFKLDPGYALRTLRAAQESRADYLVLCDTNGGTLPSDLRSIVSRVREEFSVPIAIHAHNDSDVAVANTLAAVECGATQVQGTINGFGERCGNANLCTVIPNLQLKMGMRCLPDSSLRMLTSLSLLVAETANVRPDPHWPYVGSSAFTHKGGIHVSAQARDSESYQHINPELVGNSMRVVVSELAGRSNVLYKAEQYGIDLSGDSALAARILSQVKDLESKGFQFEGAEGSFELLLRRAQPYYRAPFELLDFMVLVEKRRMGNAIMSEATVKVKVGAYTIHTAAEGDGPVNALDAALRKALLQFYPEISDIRLTDYKVRVIDESAGTGAYVRVLIETSDGKASWVTVGSSANIIEASWQALADSFEYGLTVRREAGAK